jgi:hypothetical protein
VAAVGLTPVFDGETTYFAEAELVLVCRKLYRATLTPENILDKTIVDRVYGDGDLHDMYIGRSSGPWRRNEKRKTGTAKL